jgi:hypothetical protein
VAQIGRKPIGQEEDLAGLPQIKVAGNILLDTVGVAANRSQGAPSND